MRLRRLTGRCKLRMGLSRNDVTFGWKLHLIER